MAIAAFAPTGVFALGWVFLGKTDGVFTVAGLLGALACALTVYTTSMIYASLRTVRAWADPWVAPVYLVLSLATGALLANALAHLFGVELNLDAAVMAALIGAAIVKAGYWRSIDGRGGDSTPESATGLGHLGAVHLLDPPHTGTNYLMSEMGYAIARKHAVKIRRIAFVTGIVMPLGLTAIAMVSTGILPAIAATLAALSGAIGVLIERWLFFAEAKHVVTLYYGAKAA
jgi:DMSO reductase anchor subunit